MRCSATITERRGTLAPTSGSSWLGAADVIESQVGFACF
jgi:hypothetical protein